MGKDRGFSLFVSTRARQQEKLNKLKKYLYLKDTYGIKIGNIKSYSLLPSGKFLNGKPIYFSKLTMKDGSTVTIEENIEEILDLC